MFKLVSSMNNSKPVAYIFFILGVIVLILSFFVLNDTRDFVQYSIEADGRVTNIINEEGYFYPVVEYRDRSDNLNTFQSKTGCSPSCYSENDFVKVLYLTDSDTRPRIDSFFDLWFPVVLLFLIGFIFVVASTFQLRKLNRRNVRAVT